MPTNGNPINVRHCTKENPWDHVPINPDKEILEHDDVVELDPDYDGLIPFYKCLNCGHIFPVDLR